MTTFCVDTVTVPDTLRAQHGVLRAASLQVTADATLAARRIIDDAHAEARKVLVKASREAEDVVRKAEQEALERTHRLLQALENERDRFLERGKDLVVQLAQALFERLVMDMAPRERVEAALKCITAEAPRRLINPVLRVHPDDLPCLPALEWDIKEDAGLQPGSCRLEAGNGEWCVDFDAAVASLKAALASLPAVRIEDSTSDTPDTPETDPSSAQEQD